MLVGLLPAIAQCICLCCVIRLSLFYLLSSGFAAPRRPSRCFMGLEIPQAARTSILKICIWAASVILILKSPWQQLKIKGRRDVGDEIQNSFEILGRHLLAAVGVNERTWPCNLKTSMYTLKVFEMIQMLWNQKAQMKLDSTWKIHGPSQCACLIGGSLALTWTAI